MTTPPMLSVSLARLSLCFAPLFLLACLDDDAELAGLSVGLESTGMDVANPAGPQQSQPASQPAITPTIDLGLYPDAKCNDGSAPIVKVNLDPDGGTNWLVYLQGGGSCNSVESCEDRWRDCDPSPAHSEGGQAVGGKANMMANGSGMNFDGAGILDFDGHNSESSPFAGKGFNRVFIPYCSSDHWRGQGNTQPVNYPPTCGGLESLTTLYFGGGKIVEAVIDEIMASEQAPQDGDFIVLAGGSAGGEGVEQNLDRVAAQAQAVESGVTVVGVSDSSHSVGLDQDGIPGSVEVDSELFWAGLTLPVMRNPGDPIDVVVDDSCWSGEIGSDKEYCHNSSYVVPNYMDSPIMLTSNTYDNVHDGTYETYDAAISDCGGLNVHTGGADADRDDLYDTYCDPVADPGQDIETWMRYQIGVEGTTILDSVPGTAYFIAHSSLDLHDKLLKTSENFYRRATSLAPYNVIGGHEFAGLGGWTSTSGQNSNPSVASTVACALGLVGLAGAPTCVPEDVRVTSDLPTQVPVIENAFN
jgi:hypothetical protein